MPHIRFPIPFIIIIIQDSCLCLISASRHAAYFLYILGQVPDLLQPPVVQIVIAQDPMPVYLRPKGTGPPAEVTYKISAVGNGLEGPQPDLAGLCRGRHPEIIPSSGA